MSLWKRNKADSLMAVVIVAALAFTACGSNDNKIVAIPGKPTIAVKDTSGAAVAGATVYAIPAGDVAKLSAQPITLGSNGMYDAAAGNVDEPLEDLINGNYTPAGGGVATYTRDVTDADGKAVLTGLAKGSSDAFFLYVKPAGADAAHLPGGSLCRTAVAGASLYGEVTAIKVSTTPSAAATYVGSSICLACHTSYETETKTLHKLGIMAPKAPSAMQDVSKFQSVTEDDENIYAGLNKFESGKTVYYYNYDSVKKTFKTLTTAPTGTLYFHLDLSKVGSNYQVVFTNDITSEPTMTFDVALTYGGGLHKQRYLTRLGNSLYVLPLQFNPQGSDSSADSSRTQWSEYSTVSAGWWNATTNMLSLPDTKRYKSFDASCAGCHYTGYLVSNGSSTIDFVATAVPDVNGELNPVAGTKMEMNIGCEVCHGPGSEHVDANGKGKFIVTPKNLTPEREVMICGACHTRGSGTWKPEGHGIEALLDSNARQIMPGTSRAAFLAANTIQNDALSGDRWADGKHSKKHHQQYTDYIQSKKYRNGTSIKTCANCHDVHAPGTDRHQLSGTSDNSLCLSCHLTIEVTAHMIAKTGHNMGTGTKCIDCHATKTAKSGSGSPTPGMTGVSGTKYYQNDISSHRLDVPLSSSISSTNAMPVPYTSGCGLCHDIISGL